MKKLLAVLLASCMVLLLAACGQGSGTAQTSSAPAPAASESVSETESKSASETPEASSEAAEASSSEAEAKPETAAEFDSTSGLFDPEYDYSKNPRFKFQYVSLNNSALVESFSDSLGQWAEQMNLEYLGMSEFGGDSDAFLSMLPTLAKEVDGLILDPDPFLYPRIAEIMEESGCPWMPGMAAPRNYETPNADLIHPFVGFNDYEVGTLFPAQLLAMKDQLWPDVDLSEVGFITVDYSPIPTFQLREQGCHDVLAQIAPDMMDRYFAADTAINVFDVDTSSQVVSAVLSRNTDIKYWLIFGELDDMAKGAASAVDAMGLTDTSCVAAFGGTGLITQWDAGVETAWRTACYLPTSMYTEPIINGLYAMMLGTATAETLWPEWVNVHDCGGEGKTYASRCIPCYWITTDNFKEVCKWGDIYAGTNNFPDYPADGITRDTYSPRLDPPEYYKG